MRAHASALPRYLGQHGQDYHEEVCAVPEGMYPVVAAVRAEKFQGFIASGDSILEYGAGLGYNLSAIACARKEAFDVGPHLAPRFAALHIPFTTELSSLGEGRFDAVICHHVLEHVPDPWGALAQMQRVLRPGGLLLLHVPYERERSYRRYDPSDKNGHLYSWNAQTLGALVSAAGWRLERIEVLLFGYDRFAAVLAHRLGGGERMYRLLRSVLLVLRPRYELRAVVRKP